MNKKAIIDALASSALAARGGDLIKAGRFAERAHQMLNDVHSPDYRVDEWHRARELFRAQLNALYECR